MMTPFISPPIQAVLFDLDGTLIDSIGIYYQIVAIVLERLDLPQAKENDILAAAEQDPFDWLRVMPKVEPSQKERLITSAWRIVEEAYPALFREQARLIDGVVTLLPQLARKEINIGIVTSTPRKHLDHKMAVLEQQRIAQLVKAVITADDAPFKKPAPDPLILCANQLETPVARCVYIGDTCLDIQAGKSAGMRTIAVLSGFDRAETLAGKHPDAIIPSVGHLKDVLPFL
jgi:HAD superfamily hydrolase (TIGR01549 family)